MRRSIVLTPEEFEKEHIPGSLNIPRREEGAYQKRFEKEKEIVLYCASPTCQASASVARDLVEEGYQRVVDYPGGLSDWKAGGHPVDD
jgi:rhodanese-related sulfurtransferase